MDERFQQVESQLQSFAALQERHQNELESRATAQQTESNSLAEKHVAQCKSLRGRQGREQQESWQCFSDLQKLLHTELSRERQSLLEDKRNFEAEKASMAKAGISSGDIINLDVCGERASATRHVLTQAENSLLAAKFSGRWDHQVKDGYFFLEFDPYCFKKILSYLRSKAIEGPDFPAPFPNIAPEHEAVFNQLVAHLLLEEFVGFCGMHFLFDKVFNATVSSGGTTVIFDASRDVTGLASVAPMLQTGNIYYLRCQMQTLQDPDLFLGVTPSITTHDILPEDAGWKASRGLSATQWSPIPHWSGWQESEQYLFKVDLIANTLTFRSAKSQQELQLVINHASKTPLFFCLLHRGHGTKVKLLPVLSHDVQGF